MTIFAGCDAPVDESGETSESYVCTTVGATWWNQSFAERTGTFHVNFYATPSGNNIDGVVGVSDGTATSWAKLAAIVRFNPDGYIDARAGSAYRADLPYRYSAGLRYRFDLAIDLTRHTYTVIVDTGGDQIAIARDYPFRTEQAGVTRLNNIAGFTNPETGPGSISVCEPTIADDGPPAPACITPMAGEGFRNFAITPSSTVQLVSFTAIAGRDNMDGVIGVSNGPADDYNDFAASIRFWTNGQIQARDGDTYRADVQVSYVTAQQFEVQFVVDVPSKTYSVFLRTNGDFYVELAHGYRFRTQQGSVPKIDNVAMVVASDLGGLSRCYVHGGPHTPMISFRDGTWDVHPFADGSALISDGAKTIKLDAGNVPRATLAAGGKVTADSAGNVYVANIANGVVTVRSYTSAFASRWTATLATGDNTVSDVIVSSAGQIAVALASTDQWGNVTATRIARFDAAGRALATTTLPVGSTAIGLSTNHFATATPVSGGVDVQVRNYDGSLVRERVFPGDFDINQIGIAANDTVAFGGHILGGSMTFDQCVVQTYSNSEVYWNVYVTSLRSDLSTGFCRTLTNDVTGISTTGSQIAVANVEWTQFQYVQLKVYDAAGNIVRSTDEDSFIGYFGHPGNVWLGATGRIYLNETASVGGPAEVNIPALVMLSP